MADSKDLVERLKELNGRFGVATEEELPGLDKKLKALFQETREYLGKGLERLQKIADEDIEEFSRRRVGSLQSINDFFEAFDALRATSVYKEAIPEEIKARLEQSYDAARVAYYQL